MKEWMVRDPNTKGIIITFPASEEHDAREWMREHDRYIKQEGSSLHGATLELVEFETREERIEKALKNLASYAITTRRTNQPEWMEGLAEEVNGVCDALGDEDRYRFDGDGLRLQSKELTRAIAAMRQS